ELKSAVTTRFVLGGVIAGLTVTASSVIAVTCTESGEAVPSPEIFAGSLEHPFAGAELFRGIGPSIRKSLRLLSVSIHPFPLRIPAVVLDSPGVGFGQPEFPYPRKSTIATPVGQMPVKTVAFETSATCPDPDPIETVPVASGVGRLVGPPGPCDSCTRKYRP